MSFGNTTEGELMRLIFQAEAWANIADNAATSPETNLGWALHTASPGEAGSQTTNEAAYTSYARVDVARTSGGHSESAGVVSPAANVDFPQATGGSETETYFSVAKASNDEIICFGTVTPNIVVSNGVTPRLTTATTITLD